MYKELIKDLRHCATSSEACASCNRKNQRYCQDHLHAEAADAIEKLQKMVEQYKVYLQDAIKDLHEAHKKEGVWIPVTERLPECEWGAEVGNIEWISFGRVDAGCFGRGGKYRDAYFRTWRDGAEGMDAKDADYWRQVQIPEPPKEETE